MILKIVMEVSVVYVLGIVVIKFERNNFKRWIFVYKFRDKEVKGLWNYRFGWEKVDYDSGEWIVLEIVYFILGRKEIEYKILLFFLGYYFIWKCI